MDFHDLWIEYYDEIFPFQRARFSFFLDLCSKEGFHRVLDTGCATGSYVLEFLRLSYEAVGLDLDEGMIKRAKAKALQENLKASFYTGDIRDLPALFSFDFHLLTCCGNTLPHLTSFQDLSLALQGMAQILVPGGLLVIQIVDYDRVLEEGITRLPLIKGEGFTFTRSYSKEPGNLLSFHRILESEKGRGEDISLLYPLRLEELRELMRASGFSKLHFYHDFLYTPLSTSDAPLSIVGIGKNQ